MKKYISLSFSNDKAIEVNNHISNSKYCLNRILADRSKEPIYQQVCRAKSVKDLCDALQVEYTEKLADVPSRGENSVAAKAADGGKTSYRPDAKVNKLRGVSNEASRGIIIGTDEMKQGALAV